MARASKIAPAEAVPRAPTSKFNHISPLALVDQQPPPYHRFDHISPPALLDQPHLPYHHISLKSNTHTMADDSVPAHMTASEQARIQDVESQRQLAIAVQNANGMVHIRTYWFQIASAFVGVGLVAIGFLGILSLASSWAKKYNSP
ncbi:hypothetical protein DL98DRAFT_658713 [Cadophora sp. DSE1049]|nr:hypothetical protein DL98DRAFT_658713 [Cadophora sp. DSE1049]